MLCNIKPVPFHESDKHIFAKIPGGGGGSGPPVPPLWIRPWVESKVLLSRNELRKWRFVTMVNDVINLSDCIETMTVFGSYFEQKFHDANISYFSNVSICLPLFMKDMFSLFLSLHK